MQAYVRIISETLNAYLMNTTFIVWDSEKKELVREIESFSVNGEAIQCNLAPISRVKPGQFSCHMFDGCNGVQYCILWDGKQYRIMAEDDQGTGRDLTANMLPISTDVDLANAALSLVNNRVIDNFVAEQIATYAGER